MQAAGSIHRIDIAGVGVVVKHHKDGWEKNLAVILDDFREWAIDMLWNATRLVESARERDWLRVLHYGHAFVTTTIEKLYRVWGLVVVIYAGLWLARKIL